MRFSLERVPFPQALPHLLAVVRVIAEAQATVIGDLRQVLIIKFFQAYVLRRPGRGDQGQKARTGLPREPPNLDSLPAWMLALRRDPQLLDPWSLENPTPRAISCHHLEPSSALQRIPPTI